MRLVNEIEEAAEAGRRALCMMDATPHQRDCYWLVENDDLWPRLKAALLAGEDMADWIVSEDECGKGVASIALANAFRFRAATEGTK